MESGSQTEQVQLESRSLPKMPLYVPQSLSVQFGGGDSAGINLAASQTYYFGTQYSLDPALGDDQPGWFVPVNCRLVAAYGRVTVAGTLAGAGNNSIILRKNAATDVRTLTSTTAFTAAINDWSVTGLSDQLTIGDRIYIKLTTAAFAPTPTFVFFVVNILLAV